ncbi:MAG: acyl-[acyl-carrier-protein] thioesterase [Eggerthellaceae bacterium]|jgi:medium-chain acyl-[acyl-carrier-protein] hydrolase
MRQTFNQWRADDRSFLEETTIPFALNDRNGHIKPAELSRLFMDLAGDDFGERSLSHRYMKERGHYFILTRSAVHIYRDVPDTARVMLRTWPYKIRSLQVYRGYEMRGAEGDMIAAGSGIFLVIGPEGTPIRMNDFPFVKWEDVVCEDAPAVEPKRRIRTREETVCLRTVRATFNDLDSNGHVNNARYVAYAQDSLPEPQQNGWITDMEISYDQETKIGQELQVRCNARSLTSDAVVADDDGWVRLFGTTEAGDPSFGCMFKFAAQD